MLDHRTERVAHLVYEHRQGGVGGVKGELQLGSAADDAGGAGLAQGHRRDQPLARQVLMQVRHLQTETSSHAADKDGGGGGQPLVCQVVWCRQTLSLAAEVREGREHGRSGRGWIDANPQTKGTTVQTRAGRLV